MSIWNWIWQTIIGPEESAQPPSAAGRDKTVSRSDGSVATLVDPRGTGRASEKPPSDPWFAPPEATLCESIWMEPMDLSFEEQALERVITSHLDGYNLELSPLPRVPEAVLRLLRKPDCCFREVANLISEDQAAATRVLRAANCWLRSAVPITSLPQAVARLGITPLQTIMMSESLRAATFIKGLGNREWACILWGRAVASGHVMRAIAPYADLDPEDAFMIGLLHDIGNVTVLSIVNKYETVARCDTDPDTFEYLCYQYHQGLGVLVASQWNLPPQLMAIIQDHHTRPVTDDPLRRERLALQLSDMILQMFGYAPPASYKLLESQPVCDLGLATRADFVELLKTLPDEIEQSMSHF